VHGTRQVGSTTIVVQTLSIDDSGVLDGPSTADVVCAFDPAGAGAGACLGVEWFEGTIDGRTGSASFAVGLTVVTTGFHGSFAVVASDGGLAGLRGSGSFEGGTTGTNSFDHGFV
jgi:hypothetical protein